MDRDFANFMVAMEQLLNDQIQKNHLEVEIISRPDHYDRVHLRILPVEVTHDVSADQGKAALRAVAGKAAKRTV